ncbi:MAG: pantetheine-phosphate adenylyltransferase [Candidatus Geothermarchaeota archaeon]
MEENKSVRVVIGGTFEELHVGHIKLLSEAFKIGDEILIGLTSDSFAFRVKKRKVTSYEDRKLALEKLIMTSKWNKRFTIVKIEDPYGPTIERSELDVIVVSEETYPTAFKINKLRVKRGLKPLIIRVINLVVTDAGDKLSSSDIKESRVNSWGRSIKA